MTFKREGGDRFILLIIIYIYYIYIIIKEKYRVVGCV